MRWQKKERPKHGAKRVVTRFLLFPREIGREVRWMEKARIVQQYNMGYQYGAWIDVAWIEDDRTPTNWRCFL